MDNVYDIKRENFPDDKSFQIALKYNYEHQNDYPKKGHSKASVFKGRYFFEGMYTVYQPLNKG